MNKYFKCILLFLAFFMFFDFKEVETDDFLDINLLSESQYEESIYEVKVYGENINNIISLLKDNNIDLLKVKAYQNKYNIEYLYGNDYNFIKEYTKNLKVEDKLYIENNGFLVDRIYIRSLNIDLINLEKQIKLKVLA